MIKLLFINLLSILISCSQPLNQNSCNENETFKHKFFNSISKVESYTLNQENSNISHEDFLKKLEFISKYANVNYSAISNYNIMYPNKEIFIKDKENWLRWYEENKCKNIQFK